MNVVNMKATAKLSAIQETEHLNMLIRLFSLACFPLVQHHHKEGTDFKNTRADLFAIFLTHFFYQFIMFS